MIAVSSFMPYVCGHDTYDDFLDSKTHKVRPHELFRHAHDIGYEHSKLTMKFQQIKKGVQLYPQPMSSLPILLTHGGVSAEIDAWLNLNETEIRDARGSGD